MSILSNFGFGSSGRIMLSGQEPINRPLKLVEGLSASISSGQAAIVPKTVEAMGEQLKSVFKLAHVIENQIEKLKEIEGLKEKEDKQIEKMLDKLSQQGILA